MKRFLRCISLFLVLLLILQMLPATRLNVSAEESFDLPSSTDGEVQKNTGAYTKLPDVQIIGEVESLREEDTKHFRMSDGSFTAVSYSRPVHYQDENGVWQDIDNTPIQTYAADGRGIYQIASGESSICFETSLETGKLLTMAYNEVSISMSILEPSQIQNMTGLSLQASGILKRASLNRESIAQLQSQEERFASESRTQIPDNFMPGQLSSSILYADVFPGVDIRYTVTGYNVKEDIIVRSQQESYQYDFFLSLTGLEPRVNEDGSISLLDRDKSEIYYIPTPYMADAAGEVSDLVTYGVTTVQGGIILTVEADKAWIQDPTRVFPVTIDPSVITKELNISHSASDDIYTTYVRPEYPDDASRYYKELRYTGYINTHPNNPYITYLYVNDLPAVPAGCVITSAKLKMFFSGYNHKVCTEFPVGVYRAIIPELGNQSVHEWFKSITYNTRPEYGNVTDGVDDVVDFLNFTPGGVQNFVKWDITELAQEWYASPDDKSTRLIALAPVNPYDSSNYSSQYFLADGDYYVPTIIINYRNTYGLEDYYTYQIMSAGGAGTAYLADSTGQLKVVKDLLSFNSDASPFAVNLVYNSDYFSNSQEEFLPPREMGLNMSLGAGWTLDCIQTVVKEWIDNDLYLVHRDGDGTIHYYGRYDSQATTFYDEDGLNLSLTYATNTSFRQEDRFNNYKLFSNGVLMDIADGDRNMIYINYTDNRITSITRQNKDGTEVTLATFGYDEADANLLNTITDMAGNVYTFEYDGGNLAMVKKGNAILVQYSYSGHRLTKMTDTETNYSLNFEYTAGKVSRYFEKSGSTNGASVSVTYPGRGLTVYRDTGMDGVEHNADDLLHHYLTDYAGRTINTYVTSSGEGRSVYGASNAVYGTSGKTNNRILRSSSIGVAAQNLLRNNGFEAHTGENWTCSNTSVSASNPRTGAYSLTGSTNTNAYASHASESLTEGKIYTFSAFVNTQGMTFSGNGIYLKVTDSAGNIWTSDCLNYATSPEIDGAWVRISMSFETEVSGAHTLSICLEGAVGTFYADDFQLEEGEAPSTHNLVENGAMDSSYGWTIISGVSVASGELTVAGDAARTESVAYQDIPVNLPGTTSFVLSGWGKANTAPDTVKTVSDIAQDLNKQFGLRIQITYSNGKSEYQYVPFNTDLEVWQFASFAVVPEFPEKTISNIRITCAFEKNIGTAYFDSISLTREIVHSMAYDENGMLKSVKTTDLDADVNIYSGTLLTKTITAGSGTYRYNYNDSRNKRRVSSVTNSIITESYGYNDIGNRTSATLAGSSGKKIITSSTYNAAGDLLESVTDAAGNTVSYAYNTANSRMLGTPDTVTAPNGTTTFTNYDSRNRVSQTGIANVANLQYTYNSGYLTKISRTNSTGVMQTYNLGYDGFGNMLSIRVGNRILASYEYADKTGYLTKQTDGNGNIVTYTYDDLGRVKTAAYSGGTVLTYAYNGEGELYSVTAAEDEAETKYIYTYDSHGRVVSSERKDNGTSVLRTRQYYDTVSRLSAQSWQLGADTYTEGFPYNSTQDGSLNTHTTATGQTLTMGYDLLRRLISVTGGIYGKSYTYRDVDNTKTTTQVASLSYDLPTDQSFSYTYDNMGNIATYTDSGGTVTYTYDAQGQLLSASNGYSYTYDTVGNILTGNGHTYTYGDPDWKDLLTAVDGQTITYDAVGNPTSYYNGTRWTFTWEQGRRLSTATDGNTNLSFTYDADGLRTGKTVGDVKHSYYYAGGKLLRETYGNNTLDFFYDSNGHPYALKHNGTVYYYITNLQGDVMSIVDGSGVVKASYNYDPYGNVITATGTMAEVNPLRYRGYYYDIEIELYYLQSRYYDPELGRFLNADAYISTGQGILGNDMFAYCRNNPVCRIDVLGCADEEPFDEDTGDVDATPDIEGGASLNNYGSSGATLNSSQASSGSAPQKAWDVLNYLKTNNWHPMKGYRGGRVFANDGRDGSQVLPSTGNQYFEYDIHEKIKGIDRGGERIVTDKNGSSWYTFDHYQTFIKMEGP